MFQYEYMAYGEWFRAEATFDTWNQAMEQATKHARISFGRGLELAIRVVRARD